MEKTLEAGPILDSNMRFIIRMFTYGLSNDLHICKKYDSKHIPISSKK